MFCIDVSSFNEDLLYVDGSSLLLRWTFVSTSRKIPGIAVVRKQLLRVFELSRSRKHSL